MRLIKYWSSLLSGSRLYDATIIQGRTSHPDTHPNNFRLTTRADDECTYRSRIYLTVVNVESEMKLQNIR